MLIKTFALLLTLSLAFPASASMILERTILNFHEGMKRQDLEITNPDQEPLYVKIELLEVLHPNTEQEQQNLISDSLAAKFLVTPEKLVIPAGGKKLIRFVNLQSPSDKEKVFRVNLIPVAADGNTKKTTGVKVLVGYQMLVFIQPKKLVPKLDGVISNGQLHLSNNGNTNLMLRNGTQCENPKKKKNCNDLPSKRLYPGNKWSIDLKHSTEAQYVMHYGERSKIITFKNNP